MAFFNVDFPALVSQLLPVRLRQSKTVRWLQCLITPVIELYALFTAHRSRNLYLLAHNAQVVHLQTVLNDTFDPVARGIYLTDGGYADPLYLYLSPELAPLHIGLAAETGSATFATPRWLYTDTEANISVSCFIIRIPASVTFDEYRLRAVTDRYRLAGKSNYAIQTF
jgi:hypothetical protein